MTRIYSKGGQPLDYSSDSSNFRLRLEKLSYDGFVSSFKVFRVTVEYYACAGLLEHKRKTLRLRRGKKFQLRWKENKVSQD